MNASQFNADDITGVKTDNVTGNNPNGQPVVLPFMDSNEINKKLEEHRKMLKEWDELLQRTGAPEVRTISQGDAQRHIYLKRKLHESLGVMARIVQNQIKLKKTSTDTQPSTAPPVMVNAQPNAHNYAPMNAANTSGGMLLPSITYTQQDPHAAQQVPGMAYSGASYTYPNTFMAVPMANQGAEGHQGYYTYNTGNMGQNAPSGQMPMQPQMVAQQPVQQQMYVPQQFQMSGMPGSTGVSAGVAYPTMNYSTSYAQPGTYVVAGQQPTQQMQPQQQAHQNMMQPAGGQQMQYAGNNTTNLQNNSSGNGSMPQQMMPSQPNYSQYPGMTAPMSTYGTMAPQYGKADNTSILYTQQMVAPVPTSYYGNSSVGSTSGAGGVTNGGVTQQTALSQPMSYTTYAPVGSTQAMPMATHTQYAVNTGLYNPNKDSSNQPQPGANPQ